MTKFIKTKKYHLQLLTLGLLVATISIASMNASDAASPLYVNGTSGNDTWDGTNPTFVSGTTGPMQYIQTAINAVDPDGTVNVADGTYQEHIIINKNVNLVGESQNGTIIDGTNNGRVVYIADWKTVSLTQFTIKNGNARVISDSGGGIMNRGVLNVINCTITSSTGIGGGGIYNNGYLIINGSTISSNSANHGAGIFNTWYGLTVTECNIIGNTATMTNGGGIYNGDGTVTANFNRILGNSPRAIQNYGGTVDAEYNWWGSNNPNFASLLDGVTNPNIWLYMTINATPNIIGNGETSLITASFNNQFDGATVTALNPALGHLPDGTPVTFNTDLGSIGSKTIQKLTSNGVATATLNADEGVGTAHLNAVTDAQTVYANVNINPKCTLYLTITPNITDPVVGDTVIYTLKVGNKGPDTAKDVVMTYIIPEGLEFAGAILDNGTYTYDQNTRTITWTIGDVPVGDPNMWLSLRIARTGQFIINPTLRTSTYDPTLNQNTQSLTVQAANTVQAAARSTLVQAASTTNTIGMQSTGTPIVPLAIAVLSVLGGLATNRRK